MKINTEKLETIRETLGFNKTAFAKFIGVSRPMYHNILNNGGAFKSVTIELIAQKLRIEAKDLVIF